MNDLTGTPQLLTTQVDLMAGEDENSRACPSLAHTVVFLARSSGGQNDCLTGRGCKHTGTASD